MSVNRVLSAAFLLVLSALWFFRGAFADLCPGMNNGCVDSVAVPCSAGAGWCAVVDCSAIPGGVCKCSDGTTALYYTYEPPNSWTDCVSDNDFGPCSRVSMGCAIVWLAKVADDCGTDSYCGMNQTSGCTNSSFTSCH